MYCIIKASVYGKRLQKISHYKRYQFKAKANKELNVKFKILDIASELITASQTGRMTAKKAGESFEKLLKSFQ